MSTALGIVLAVAAMPAAADWRNFSSQPIPRSGDVLIPDTLLDQELPQDDPIDLPDPITELNDLPPLDLGDEPLLPTPSVGRHSIGLDPTDFLGAGTRHYLSVRARVARDGVQHGVPKAT